MTGGGRSFVGVDRFVSRLVKRGRIGLIQCGQEQAVFEALVFPFCLSAQGQKNPITSETTEMCIPKDKIHTQSHIHIPHKNNHTQTQCRRRERSRSWQCPPQSKNPPAS